MTSEHPEPRAAAGGHDVRLAYFEIRSTDAGHHALIVGGNGEPVLTSEVHPDVRDAEHAIDVAIEAVATIFTGAETAPVRRVDERTKAAGS